MTTPPVGRLTQPNPDAAHGATSVTVVVPTFREAANIPHLIARLQAIRENAGLDMELLLMDDDSDDGSVQLVESLALPWVRIVSRKGARSLSHAVIDGLKLAGGEVVVVMDAALSNPPEKIPELIAALKDGVDLAVGSRYVEGGSTAHRWGAIRWLNSRVAKLLALPLTSIKDPMSGIFALRRSTLSAAHDFDPVGHNILLEIIVRCKCRTVVEVPIDLAHRRHGESKLSIREQLQYFQHLRRLYIHRYGTWSHLAQFLMVGASGLVVNLAVLTLCLRLDVRQRPAVLLAIIVSLTWNFALNRRFSFSYARHRSLIRQFGAFVAACSVGTLVNYFTTMALWQALTYKQLAAMIGVLAGTAFNFTANRYVVFRATHARS